MTQPHVLKPLPPELRARPVTLQVQSARGAARVISLSASSICVQSLGHLDAELARQIRDATLKAAEAAPPIVALVDWAEMRSYGAEARQTLTQMVLSNRDAFREVLILTGSTIVSVGVSTAGLATSLVGVTVSGTTDRNEFMTAVRRHVT